jgi:hypothetical protein
MSWKYFLEDERMSFWLLALRKCTSKTLLLENLFLIRLHPWLRLFVEFLRRALIVWWEGENLGKYNPKVYRG